MKVLRAALLMMAVTACGAVTLPAAATPAYVPWVELPPQHQYAEAPLASPVPPVPVPAGTPACQATQLEGVNPGSAGATGNVNMPILLRNKSGADCYLEGYPDVSVLGAGGTVLASASGQAGRGTYFNDGPVVQVMLKAGEPPMPQAGPGNPAPVGDAYMNLSWYDCRQPEAAKLALDLPGGGGRLIIPFVMTAAYYSECDTSASFVQVERGPFSPTGVDWPPSYDYLKVAVAISAPQTVKRGSPLTYLVTITDNDSRDFVLSPCPDYFEMLAVKRAAETYQLNCAPVRSIPAGGQVTFQIRLDIPAGIQAGPNTVSWFLEDGRIEQSQASAPITIT